MSVVTSTKPGKPDQASTSELPDLHQPALQSQEAAFLKTLEVAGEFFFLTGCLPPIQWRTVLTLLQLLPPPSAAELLLPMVPIWTAHLHSQFQLLKTLKLFATPELKLLAMTKSCSVRPSSSVVKEDRWCGQMKPAGEVVMEAIQSSGNAILRDYTLEIVVLSMGAKSKVGGLKEFCVLASLTLTLDCVLFGTFYAAMLAIMVKVQRIKAARDMTRYWSSNSLSECKLSALVRPPQVQDASLSHQPSETLLVSRIASFLTLHILNFATTLTPVTISRYQTQTLIGSARTAYSVSHRVDIASPAIASVLANLAAINTTLQVEIEVKANVSTSTDLSVKIAPPLYIRVTPPGPVRPRALFRSTDAIENFMTGWTILVDDPILSKWIVLVLAVSVALKDYLLKGIAEGAMHGLQPNNVHFRSVVAEKCEKDNEEIVIPRVRAAGGRRRSSFVVGDSKPSSPSSSDSEKPIVHPLAIRSMQVIAPIAIPATAGASAQMLDMKLCTQAAPAPREDQPIQFPHSVVGAVHRAFLDSISSRRAPAIRDEEHDSSSILYLQKNSSSNIEQFREMSHSRKCSCIVSSQTKTHSTSLYSRCSSMGFSAFSKLGRQVALTYRSHAKSSSPNPECSRRKEEYFTKLLESLASAGYILEELAKMKTQSIQEGLVDLDDLPESQMNIPMKYSELEDKHFPLSTCGWFSANSRGSLKAHVCDTQGIAEPEVPPGQQINYLYIDEAQDNLLINALFLRRLCRIPNGSFCAGDTAQTISGGSSFRFDDSKVFLYCVEQQQNITDGACLHQPMMFKLAINYRIHGGIINCAHSVTEPHKNGQTQSITFGQKTGWLTG
ncbi:uncharacterized protein F5147DRAFT_819882 [Suillus discolor]|uniref:SSD domain-containing protein n=1 Tax=Suillus discolor TaxID=1912936 RepID=A0A9P7EXX5_9AGAM|nr:uncharacterized protein F5147DRAFT_819882 [Suillus discolor]KAG2094642.1 hypothetical protein F5147DRAFT_819882 [Suillus discolor]